MLYIFEKSSCNAVTIRLLYMCSGIPGYLQYLTHFVDVSFGHIVEVVESIECKNNQSS